MLLLIQHHPKIWVEFLAKLFCMIQNHHTNQHPACESAFSQVDKTETDFPTHSYVEQIKSPWQLAENRPKWDAPMDMLKFITKVFQREAKADGATFIKYLGLENGWLKHVRYSN